MEYNSQRKKMIIPEYGRNVQLLIEYAKTIENREKRNIAILDILRQMAIIQQGNIKDSNELERKLWDHLFIMANFELDVDSPYKKPDKDKVVVPEKLKYNTDKQIPYRYYGAIVLNMIKEVSLMEEGDEKKAIVHDIANNMKKLYLTWNKGVVNDVVIFEHLKELSNGHISLSEDTELSTNLNIPTLNDKSSSRSFKKKRKSYSNGTKKYHKKN